MARKTDRTTERGHVIWHSSDGHSGPDVGLSLGLGGGRMLWLGEMPRSTIEEHDIDIEKTGDGWWLVLYGDKSTDIAGAVVDVDAARALFDALELALRGVSS